MDQKIKNFDRGIEQMMNEHQVAPPFGAWNRISAELDAMPGAVAAGAAPVASSLIPKRAMLGIIAAALVIGSSALTGYLINSSHNNDHVNNTVAKTTMATTNTKTPVTAQTEPVKNIISPTGIALTKVQLRHIAATTPAQSTILAAQQVVPVVNEPVASLTPTPVINNENTDVPTPLEPVAQRAEDTQTYFFPPIDVNTPEKTAPAKETLTNKSHNTETTVAGNSDDDKPVRKRFHPKRRQKFTYGNIIR